MNKYLIALVAVVVLILVLITGYLFLNTGANKNLSATTQNGQTAVNTKNIPVETITLTSSGFQPQTLTIKLGTRVIWINNSGTVGTVNSDNYPTNLLYPFLNFGQFNSGSSFSTIFSKTGTYTYYNFLNQSQKGKIIVE
jgi:plastocyanin